MYGAHTRASFLAGMVWPVEDVEDPHWSIVFLKDCTMFNGPMLEHLWKSCSL